ncbi:hypothetical protein CYMTET_29764 [Cymbomonas tetramitiformis]|uniref:Glycosyl hydrolases family 2 sugar binding domain-containing protein n=1 Tax=Cymbomonas tetramitiformis TaxID=36881 RepID=A0AAE0FKD6_9CHLO|nr:hypothetical protein CYMTET_29764 [Cymbomonas tetramitiformis]
MDLPHDFIVEGNFTKHANEAHGYLPYAMGCYYFNFSLPQSARGKSVSLEFEGVQRNSTTWLNDAYLGNHPSGYTPFRFDLAESALKFGSINALFVFVDATHPDGWWYDGGGIYRNVWLHIVDRLHVVPWGVYLPAEVTSPISGAGTADARLSAETTVVNTYNATTTFALETLIKRAVGRWLGMELPT